VFADVCDVGQPGAIEAFLDAARAALGGIDILVNNATGYGFNDQPEAWRVSIDVDLMAAVRACWKVVPWMTEAGGGAIVHISSIAGLYANPNFAYSAAKAAVISHSKSLAIELAPSRIRVNVVCPGSIFLPDGLWDQVRQRDPERFQAVVDNIPSGRMGHPQEVADAVVYLCSDRASWVTGRASSSTAANTAARGSAGTSRGERFAAETGRTRHGDAENTEGCEGCHTRRADPVEVSKRLLGNPTNCSALSPPPWQHFSCVSAAERNHRAIHDARPARRPRRATTR
jgi:3-oxoacyl-[acyl-carrier protein] reductase